MPKKPAFSVAARAGRIRLLLMDVDGVLTDGRLYYLPSPDGSPQEMKGFDSQDGIALRWLADRGFETGVISGRQSSGVEQRARILGMRHVHQGHLVKLPVFERILADSGFSSEQVAFVGDDIPDLPVMLRCGLAVAAANARMEVKKAAHMVTRARGGSGAVREVCEILLKAQGHWEALVGSYRQAPAAA